ncbi:MAG TPA: ABC transporter ATP-binding protein [Hyphomicrobiales bacterium]|nr:ABC transporter ATP-binding protein [Hyphomicrobiales bacterium]
MAEWLQVEDIAYTWPGQAQRCLDGLYFSARQGEKVFIAGASGSGKSTFLNLLAGILRPQRGRIVIGGTAVHELGARALDRFRARHVGLVFQAFNLIPFLDVETNIRLASHFNEGRRVAGKEIAALLHKLRLDPALARRRASELSVGQQQRVAVARALVNRPQLLVADEPTSALDADSQQAFMELLMSMSGEYGATVLFVSHDQRLSARFDRVVELAALQASAVAGGR